VQARQQQAGPPAEVAADAMIGWQAQFGEQSKQKLGNQSALNCALTMLICDLWNVELRTDLIN
jgi:hypothetical protein